MTAVLPLISPEKGDQLGFVAQGCCSSSRASTTRRRPARVDAVALDDLAGDLRARGHPRRDPRRGQRRPTLWGDIWPLLVIGAVAVPLGLCVFRRGERTRSAREAEAVGMSGEAHFARGRRRTLRRGAVDMRGSATGGRVRTSPSSRRDRAALELAIGTGRVALRSPTTWRASSSEQRPRDADMIAKLRQNRLRRAGRPDLLRALARVSMSCRPPGSARAARTTERIRDLRRRVRRASLSARSPAPGFRLAAVLYESWNIRHDPGSARFPRFPGMWTEHSLVDRSRPPLAFAAWQRAGRAGCGFF